MLQTISIIVSGKVQGVFYRQSAREKALAIGVKGKVMNLSNGKNLEAWRSVKDTTQPAGWEVADGIITVNKKAGNIETKQRFMDYQLHIEWRIPENITGSDQARGNSGVFLASSGPGDNGYELRY